MKFKHNIEIQAGVAAGGSTGSNGQVLSSTGSGVAWINQIDVVSSADSAESVHISVKNTSGAQILKGTPVYVTGETGNSGKIEVAPADASDSAKMPALGLLESTLDNNGEGFCVQGGLLEELATATIDGTATTANDTVYVKSGGGLTMTKPTGTGLIQNIAKVARAHASNGTLVVSSILRTNDVPNLTTGKIWVGDGNTTESTVVHLDEVNGRMGIGTTDPTAQLHLFQPTLFNTADLFRIQHNEEVWGLTVAVNDFIVKSTGNVGIGTISPGYKLTVNGPSRSTNLTIADYIFHEGDINTYMGFPSIDTISWNTNGSERMRINSLGNVGIGTTNPAYKLDVNGSLHSTNLNIADAIYHEGDTNTYIQFVDNDTIRWVTSGAERMRLISSGNVGIGNISPQASLHATNNDNAYGSQLIIQNQNAGTGAIAQMLFQTNNFGYGLAIRSFNSDGTATIANTANAPLTIFTNNTERMRISSSGNVGIGTTIPGGKLDVEAGDIGAAAGDATTAAIFRAGRQNVWFQNQRTAAGADWHNNTFKIIAKIDDTSHQSINFVNDASFNEHIDIYTGNQVFNTRFDANGNVGIGTTNPLSLLSLGERGSTNGDLRLSAAGSGINEGASILWDMIVGGGNSISHIAEIRPESYATGVNKNILNFYVGGWNNNQDSGTAKMTITSDGDVGIGTTNPGAKLTLSTPNAYDGTILQLQSRNEPTAYNLKINEVVGAGIVQWSFDMINGVSVYNNVLVFDRGGVGIGKTDPSYNLDVSGTGRFTSTVTATDFITSSDLRLKKNIQDYSFDKKINISLKTYEFISDGGRKRYGVIAQDLEKTNPEFVITDRQGYKSVSYIDLLIAKIAELENRLKTLENK